MCGKLADQKQALGELSAAESLALYVTKITTQSAVFGRCQVRLLPVRVLQPRTAGTACDLWSGERDETRTYGWPKPGSLRVCFITQVCGPSR